MNFSNIRKVSLQIFIGFLALTALFAIGIVFIGDFGTIEMRILGTSFTISIASICAMACAAFIEKKELISIGLTGIICSALGGIFLIFGIWSVFESDIYFKITFTLITASFAFAHAFLLALPELYKRHLWIQKVTALTIAILSIQIIFAMWLEIDAQVYYRFMAAVAILVGLETLTIPILMKLKSGDGEEKEKLNLEQVEGMRYKDSSGNIYSVSKVSSKEMGDKHE